MICYNCGGTGYIYNGIEWTNEPCMMCYERPRCSECGKYINPGIGCMSCDKSWLSNENRQRGNIE